MKLILHFFPVHFDENFFHGKIENSNFAFGKKKLNKKLVKLILHSFPFHFDENFFHGKIRKIYVIFGHEKLEL